MSKGPGGVGVAALDDPSACDGPLAAYHGAVSYEDHLVGYVQGLSDPYEAQCDMPNPDPDGPPPPPPPTSCVDLLNSIGAAMGDVYQAQDAVAAAWAAYITCPTQNGWRARMRPRRP